jgi:hypothetical protein
VPSLSPQNTSQEAIHHPGYLLSYNWELEITHEGRENTDRIILAVNNFNLPERTSRTFDIIWGPGYPAMTYPGPVGQFEFALDVTNFYEKGIVEYLVCWHERTLIDFLPNLRDGYVIGYDDDKIIRYKADVYKIWPTAVRMGEMNRDTSRQRISATLAVWDIIHDFNFDKFEFEEGCK